MSSAETRKRYKPESMAVYMRAWRKRRKSKPPTPADAVKAALRAEKRAIAAARPSKIANQWLLKNIKLENLPTLIAAADIGANLPVDVGASTKTFWSAKHLRALGAHPITVPIPGSVWSGWVVRDCARVLAMTREEKLALLNEVTGSKYPIWPPQMLPDGPDDPETGEPINGYRWATDDELARLNADDADDADPDETVNDSNGWQPSRPVAANGSGGTDGPTAENNALRTAPARNGPLATKYGVTDMRTTYANLPQQNRVGGNRT